MPRLPSSNTQKPILCRLQVILRSSTASSDSSSSNSSSNPSTSGSSFFIGTVRIRSSAFSKYSTASFALKRNTVSSVSGPNKSSPTSSSNWIWTSFGYFTPSKRSVSSFEMIFCSSGSKVSHSSNILLQRAVLMISARSSSEKAS